MKRIVLSIFAIFSLLTLSAEQIKAPKIVLGPYIQACGPNQFTVIWQTDTEALSWVEIAPDDGTHFYNVERERFYHTIHGRRPITT